MRLPIASVQNSISKNFEVDLRSRLRMVLLENCDADFCLLVGRLQPKFIKLPALSFKSESSAAGVVGILISSWRNCKSIERS